MDKISEHERILVYSYHAYLDVLLFYMHDINTNHKPSKSALALVIYIRLEQHTLSELTVF
jgi:hypothetical protein